MTMLIKKLNWPFSQSFIFSVKNITNIFCFFSSFKEFHVRSNFLYIIDSMMCFLVVFLMSIILLSAPSQPPSNLTVRSGNSTSLSVKWTPVPECCHFGIIKGYHVTLTDSNNSSVTITKNFTELEARFVNLKKFNLYQISVNAFTSKGAGPKICTSVSTDQDGMSILLVS